MSRLHLYFLAMVLSLIGLSLFLYKALVLHFPVSPHEQTSIWTVEAQVSFNAKNKSVKAALFIPRNTAGFLIMDENFISRGFGLTTSFKSGNRQAVWSIRRAVGQQELYYRAVIQKLDTVEVRASSKKPELEPPAFDGPYLKAAESLLAEIGAKSADIESLVSELINHLNSRQPDQNVRLLLGKKPNQLKRAEVAVRILLLHHIPARLVHGIDMGKTEENVKFIPWIEVHESSVWKPFSTETGTQELPEGMFPWWTGPDPLIQAEGADRAQANISLEVRQEESVNSSLERIGHAAPLFLDFSLFSLPIHTQGVYRVLLLVPIGAFLVVVLRNAVGIKTFGTFMPILVALAFRETELVWGLVLFILLAGLGLAVRFYFEHLKLLLVPRLASVLIVVILLMAALSIITHKLGIGHGLSLALFPMVIITMTIERMSIVWDEFGAATALRQGIGTLLVATVTYMIINIDYLEHLIFVFPELLLIVLAATLLMGRYTGYRLLELRRFKVLADPQA